METVIQNTTPSETNATYSIPENIKQSIDTERNKQIKTHGGPLHDEKHTHIAWIGFIAERLNKTETRPHEFRKNMVKIAATAIAAVEAFDRGGACNHLHGAVTQPNERQNRYGKAIC